MKIELEEALYSDCDCHHGKLSISWHTPPCPYAKARRLLYRLAAMLPDEDGDYDKEVVELVARKLCVGPADDSDYFCGGHFDAARAVLSELTGLLGLNQHSNDSR